MALSPLAIHDLAETVLACVCEALDQVALEVEGHPGCPTCRTCVVPGQAAWDGCDDPCGSSETGGQLSVGYARIYGTTRFPEPDLEVQGLRGCKPPATMAAEMVVTLLRCAPIVNENGCPPTCEELSAAARVTHVDAATVYNALLCCLPHTGSRKGRRFVMGEQRVIGPQGGCVGIEQRVIVALPGCAPCPEGESL